MNYQDILYALLYAPVFIFWGKEIFRIELPRRRWWLCYVLCVLSLAVPSVLLSHGVLRVFGILGGMILSCSILMRKSFFKGCLAFATSYFTAIFAEIPAMGVCFIMYKGNPENFKAELSGDGYFVNILTWIFMLIIMLAAYLAATKRQKFLYRKPRRASTLSLVSLLTVISYLIIYTLVMVEIVGNVSILSSLLILLLPGVAYIIIVPMYLSRERSKEHLEELLEMQQSSLNLYENSREFTHDYKNLMLYFQGCIKNGDYEKMGEAVNEKLADVQEIYNFSYKIDLASIEDSGIRWIFISKISEAIRGGIIFEVSHFDNIDCIIRKNEFLEILGILIDNALESAADSEKRKIVFSLNQKEDGYVLSIANTFSAPPALSKIFEKNYTTKENHSGIGLNRVKKIADKYSRLLLNAEVTDDFFVLTIECHDQI